MPDAVTADPGGVRRETSACGGGEDWGRLLTGSLTDAERQRLVEHLSRCPSCRRQLAVHQDLTAPIPLTDVVPTRLRQRAIELVDEPSGSASARRATTESSAPRHVARHGHHAGSAPRRRQALLAAVAASLIAAAGLGAWLGLGELPEPAETRSLAAAIAAPQLEDPVPRPNTRTVDLRWSATPGAQRYRLTVIDGLGAPVREVDLDGDRREYALDLRPLPSDRDLHWRVQARFADGTALSSSIGALPQLPP